MADAGNGVSTLAGIIVNRFLVRVHGGAFSGGEPKCQKYNNHKDGGAVDASEWIVEVDCNGCKGAGARDDDCNHHQSSKSWFCFDFEVDFHGRQGHRWRQCKG